MKMKAKYADLSLLLVAFGWGATFVVIQNAISILPPFSFNGLRFSIASIILGILLLFFYRTELKRLNKKMLFSGIFLGVWLFLGYAAQTAGLLYTTSSKAGFITGLNVVLVPILSLFIFKQKLSKNAAIGIAVATIGLYLLTMTDVSPFNKGDLLVLLCAICFAMQIVITDKLAKQIPALLLTVIQLSTVAVLSIIASLLFEDWRNVYTVPTLLNWGIIFALFITAVFATSFAFFAQTYFQQFTSPTRVALIFATEPVFAAITGFFWANEKLSLSALMGCILIFAGMIFSELQPQKLFAIQKEK